MNQAHRRPAVAARRAASGRSRSAGAAYGPLLGMQLAGTSFLEGSFDDGCIVAMAVDRHFDCALDLRPSLLGHAGMTALDIGTRHLRTGAIGAPLRLDEDVRARDAMFLNQMFDGDLRIPPGRETADDGPLHSLPPLATIHDRSGGRAVPSG